MGYVFLTDGIYVGVTSDGTTVREQSEEIALRVEAAYQKFSSSRAEKISLPTSVGKNILSASKTDSGNLIIEARGAGYGILGEWHSSGEYIKVKASIDREGKIIDIITAYQNESEGVGDVCGLPSYYGQYVGKDKSDYGEVADISGATVTSSGYKKAVKDIFNAAEILRES